jgi:hypothetical protein
MEEEARTAAAATMAVPVGLVGEAAAAGASAGVSLVVLARARAKRRAPLNNGPFYLGSLRWAARLPVIVFFFFLVAFSF